MNVERHRRHRERRADGNRGAIQVPHFEVFRSDPSAQFVALADGEGNRGQANTCVLGSRVPFQADRLVALVQNAGIEHGRAVNHVQALSALSNDPLINRCRCIELPRQQEARKEREAYSPSRFRPQVRSE